METQYVPEVDVIIAVVKWLHSEGWTVERLSIPSGQKIDSVASKNQVQAQLTSLGIEERSVRFTSKGEDIRASKDSILWKIECKGLGGDERTSTVRNQFDRALASTVSYYDQDQGLQVAIALPEEYIKHIRSRLPKALRTALNMWVFLYISADDVLLAFSPDYQEI